MNSLVVRLLMVMVTWLGAAFSASAADTYLPGNISNITSYAGGLLIMLDSGVPGNCQGTPYGWMRIPEENKTMVSVALSMWVADKKGVVVYTSGLDGSGYCLINQFDPN